LNLCSLISNIIFHSLPSLIVFRLEKKTIFGINLKEYHMNTENITERIAQLEKDEEYLKGEVQGYINQQTEIAKKFELSSSALHGVRNQLLYYKSLVGGGDIVTHNLAVATELIQPPNNSGLSTRNSIVVNVEYLITKEFTGLVGNSDIAAALQPYYKGLDSITLTHRVSNALWILRNKNKVDSYCPSGQKRNTVWGRSEFFESNGVPKEQYREEYERKNPEHVLQG
jgi:hypothetical protein